MSLFLKVTLGFGIWVKIRPSSFNIIGLGNRVKTTRPLNTVSYSKLSSFRFFDFLVFQKTPEGLLSLKTRADLITSEVFLMTVVDYVTTIALPIQSCYYRQQIRIVSRWRILPNRFGKFKQRIFSCIFDLLEIELYFGVTKRTDVKTFRGRFARKNLKNRIWAVRQKVGHIKKILKK